MLVIITKIINISTVYYFQLFEIKFCSEGTIGTYHAKYLECKFTCREEEVLSGKRFLEKFCSI